jgi:hypothetical protein
LIQPRTRRSRWPILLVVVGAVAIGAWALLRQPSIRRRIDEMAREARDRLATMGARDERLDMDADEPIAPRSVPTAAIADTDGIPAFEEAGSPG